MAAFRFRRFSVRNENPALKVGTDAVLLGAAMPLRGDERHILDIGTGSGTIALMAAQRLCDIREEAGRHITAIDIDVPSIEEAALNFKDSPWKDILEARLSALQDYVPEVAPDLIFSNPPYYDNSLLNPDGRESGARHTVSLSYRDILAFSERFLSADGTLSMILPSDSEKTLLRTAASFGLYPFLILRVKTTEAKPPRRIVISLSRKRTSPEEKSLTIMDGGKYSDAYRALTGEFYLGD